jgi:hypothetical protein
MPLAIADVAPPTRPAPPLLENAPREVPSPAAGEFERLLAVATGLAKAADPEAEVPVRPAPPP